jgi:hypothetical protein
MTPAPIRKKILLVLLLLRTSATRSVLAGTSDGGRCFFSKGTRSSCFVPCASPRFDVFAEQLIGSWTSASSALDKKEEKIPVEEVMRSCGGAVQGIRERPLLVADEDDNNGSEESSGLYLNRANDGFVFFDSGSYSFGPTSIPAGSDPAMSEDLQVANLMLGKTSRLLLTSGSSTKDPLLLRKTFSGAELPVPTIQWEHDANDNPCETHSIEVLSTIQCSMPSPDQPWNLQRAKWSKSVIKSSDNIDVNIDDDSPIGNDLCCWLSSHQPASEFSIWAGGLLKLAGGYDSDGSVSQMGTICRETGSFQSMARIYNAGGALSNVLYLQGRVQS